MRRRVARDGSSQYAINQSTCRLTDVVELMAQVGLGRELHSIIGQGKVESFLAGKPEDRRSQIEEAAGLGTYKRRRERAELKLREVRRNLERADLLEREVNSQLAPLRRQANAAEQLRAVEADLDETRGRLLSGDIAAVDAELAPAATSRRASSKRSGRAATRGSRVSPASAPRKRRRSRGAWPSVSAWPSACCAPACSTVASRVRDVSPSSGCACSRRSAAPPPRSASGSWASWPAEPEEDGEDDWPAEERRLAHGRRARPRPRTPRSPGGSPPRASSSASGARR